MSIFNFFSSKITSEHPHRAGLVKPTEKRREVRHETFFTAAIKYKNKELISTVLNYSESGLGMLVGKPLRPNQPVEVILTASNQQPVIIQADIKRCLNTGNDYMVGVQAAATDAQYASLFRSFNQHPSTF